MYGRELCDVLRKQFDCESDQELAVKIGLTPARISQIRSDHSVLKADSIGKLIGRAFQNGTESAFRSAIRPVVEFFPIEISQVREQGRDIPFNPKENGGAELAKCLRASHGLYAFYNSQAEIIYFGKADRLNLYEEIINVFNRDIPHFKIYSVKHPWGRFKSSSGDDLRKIKLRSMKLSSVAGFFSAYDVEPYLISALEALFIRLVPNDIINVRIEQKDMKAFKEPQA